MENFHAATAFEILLQDECNILEGLSDVQYITFRRNLIKLILSTDMGQHFEIISKFQSRIATGPLTKSDDDRLLLATIILKCADISNISRPFEIAKKWAHRCIAEFFNQGDLEKERGLPVGAQNDRNTVCLPKSQIGFCDFIAGTIVKQIVVAFPSLSKISDAINSNRERWQKMLEMEIEKETCKNTNDISEKDAKKEPTIQENEKPVEETKKEIPTTKPKTPEKVTEPEEQKPKTEKSAFEQLILRLAGVVIIIAIIIYFVLIKPKS